MALNDLTQYEEQFNLFQRRLGETALLFRGRGIRMPLSVKVSTPGGQIEFAYLPQEKDARCFQYRAPDADVNEYTPIIHGGLVDPAHMMTVVADGLGELLRVGIAERDRLTEQLEAASAKLEVLGT